MAYRAVELPWQPRSSAAWSTFTKARKAAASAWNALVIRHERILRLGWQAPTFMRWSKWAARRFADISAQSVQAIVIDFWDALRSARLAAKAQRASGAPVNAKAPWRRSEYRDVPYPNQTAKLRGGWLVLPHGKRGGVLRIRLPKDRPLPGRLMEVSLRFGSVIIICKTDDEVNGQRSVIGVDLGVNTAIAASDGVTAVVVNGSELKAIRQYRDKRTASARSKIDRSVKGSRRQKRIQRRKSKHEAKCGRKIRDIHHKATRVVADQFPGAAVVVGNSFQSASRKLPKQSAQQLSRVSTSKLTEQLAYKLSGARKVSEAYSSQTCPVCGCRQTCRRVYRCKACGLVAPRDVVGAVNIRAIGLYGALTPGQSMPTVVRFVRPLRKYPGPARAAPGSSGGTPASSSETA